MTTDEQRAKWRQQHQKNREKRLAAMKARYQRNKEAAQLAGRAWHETNKERANARRRDHHWAHREQANQKRRLNMRKSREALPWKFALKGAAERAQRKGLEFTLTDQWAKDRWTGRCELTGMWFAVPGIGSGPRSFSASIDRIVPEVGYTPNNCRFILFGLNALKGGGLDTDMFMIARALMERHG